MRSRKLPGPLEDWEVILKVLSPLRPFSQSIFLSLISWLLGGLQAPVLDGIRGSGTWSCQGEILASFDQVIIGYCELVRRKKSSLAQKPLLDNQWALHLRDFLWFGHKGGLWKVWVGVQRPGLERGPQEWWPFCLRGVAVSVPLP